MAHGEARGMQERPECSEQHDGVFVRAATRLGDPAAKYFVAVVRHQTELVSGQEFELKVICVRDVRVCLGCCKCERARLCVCVAVLLCCCESTV